MAPPPLLQEHTWRIPGGKDILARIEAAEDQLASAGWTMESSQRNVDGRPYFLSASLGSRLVEVYETMHFSDSGKLGDRRSLTVFHQLRPEAQELLEWLEDKGEPAEQRDAAVELIQSLHVDTRKALRALRGANSSAASAAWFDRALKAVPGRE